MVYIKIIDKESIWPKEEDMGRRDHCCVGTCNNDTRCSDRYEIKNHVTTLKFHRFPTNDEAKRNAWPALVNKGRVGFIPSDGSRICSNHFPDGKPTPSNPNPTLWLTIQQNRENEEQIRRPSPKTRLLLTSGASNVADDDRSSDESEEKSELDMPVPLRLQHLNREFNIRCCTGIETVETFKAIYDFLFPRSKIMKYWEGPKKSAQATQIATVSKSAYQRKPEDVISSEAYVEIDNLPINRMGPRRKLSLEQEYLLVLMCLRLGLLVKDLVFRFHISSTRVSQIWITWIKLLSKELRYLIRPGCSNIARCFQEAIFKSKSNHRLYRNICPNTELP